MKRDSRRVRFESGRGSLLSGVLEWPEHEPRNFAVLSHCFTCGKDLKAIVRIARRLARSGIAVLRFDFTGIGESEGDFSQTSLSTNCEDILAAARYLENEHSAPALLIGLSLGGTASVLVAGKVPSARVVATIASPGSTGRLAGFLSDSNPEIESNGAGHVVIGGVPRLIRRQLLDDLRSYDILERMGTLTVPILMFHSPQDDLLPYSWGLQVFEAATGAKSFITLDGADHLLTERPGDAEYVADMIAGWSSRYL
jgi:fermentation-respiration switch protein FrsA (DUF1100 family)